MDYFENVMKNWSTSKNSLIAATKVAVPAKEEEKQQPCMTDEIL